MIKTRNPIIFLAILAGLFLIVYIASAQPVSVQTELQKWEYADVYFKLSDAGSHVTVTAPSSEEQKRLQQNIDNLPSEEFGMVGFLNVMGNAGWELVSKDIDQLGNFDLIFKRPLLKSPSLSKTSFYFPQDGTPNDHNPIGPFCCTGRTATILTTNGDAVGYIYFYGWRQALQEGPYVSFAPDIKVLVSSLANLSDLSSKQEQSSVDFTAQQMVPGASHTVQAGSLYFTVTIATAPLETFNQQSYFNMQAVTIRVDVSTSSPN